MQDKVRHKCLPFLHRYRKFEMMGHDIKQCQKCGWLKGHCDVTFTVGEEARRMIVRYMEWFEGVRSMNNSNINQGRGPLVEFYTSVDESGYICTMMEEL